MFSKITLILVIICMTLGIALLMSVKSCNKNKRQVKTIKEISYSIIHDTVEYKTDKFGTVHAQKKVISGSKKALDVFYKPKFDSLCDAYDIKSKQLDQFISLRLADSGRFVAPLVTSEDGRLFAFEDDYIYINGIVTDTNITCSYSIDVPLDIGIFWKRKHKIWFIKFGKKMYRIDAASPNKSVFVKDLLNVKITKDL